MSDKIDHPAHYCAGRKYEPIDVIEDWNLDFCLGNAVKYISRAGRKSDKIPSGTILRLGGMTDPFAPIESLYGRNGWLIEELNQRDIGYLIVTKSATVADCLDVLDKDLAHVQISYTYTEGLEPAGYENASSPRDRLKSARKLFEAGIDTQIRLSPYVPSYVDLRDVLGSPVDKVIVEFLRVNGMIRRQMPTMDFSEWTVKSGGYCHLPLEKKTILDRTAYRK